MLKSKLLPTKTQLGNKKNLIIIFTFVVLLVVFVVSYQVDQILQEPMNLWENNLPSSKCGIVLTGAPGRVRDAFEYLAQKKIKKLIVSGVYKESKLHEVFPYLPFYPEINPDDIVLEKKSETTYGNAQQCLALVQDLNCDSVVLITSQIHMRRAYRIFNRTFPKNIEIKKLSLPNSRSEKSLTDLCLEAVKSIFYFALGLAA